MTNYLEEILAGKNIRENLIKLKQELKIEDQKQELVCEIKSKGEAILQLLKSEDAKVRKNTAFILGELKEPDYLKTLFDTYVKESQMFVKSAYLIAMSKYDYRVYLDKLEERLSFLRVSDIEESAKKHVAEEMKVLQNMIWKYKEPKKHEFVEPKQKLEIILTTQKNYSEVTSGQLKETTFKNLNAGVKIVTNRLMSVLPIRTYKELLFTLNCDKNLEKDVSFIAEKLVQSNLMSILKDCHKGEAPFYFRIELKSKMSLDKKSSFAKRVALELESLSNGQLINSTSHYEIEIRLIESNAGKYYPCLKLFTIPDDRFSYRQDVIAASIHPTTAALLAEISKEYMMKGAQILDPFCGVGTMLIERNKAIEAGTMYGIDYFGDAIKKARNNTERADMVVNYIQRDYFQFTHEYLFDEIFTNMPVQGRMGKEELNLLYERFFQKSKEVLKANGLIFMYSNEMGYVKKHLRIRKDYSLIREFCIDEKKGFYLFLIAVKE
ncbi:methyltransferase [Anaerosacchariphilus polymeriproducens]|uniref:Methyltransferase domain-containing protein n=1 Tax=Anaerosacchariphilus polymeriproducens TaxID=1812858 RepID=A0A371AWT1_9FIRM|nr:methyltransferase [Anaerosacchariphilus polymeriproducens]RDU24001.1 methyltransferase domain-containing protein [Anaerosacchariphilus polymeriproducens]